MQSGKIKLVVIILVVAGLLLVAGVVRKARKEPPPQEVPHATTSTPSPETGAQTTPATPAIPETSAKPTTPSTFTLEPGDYTRDVPGWNGRPYDLYIPKTYNPSRPTALVLAIHGGGGNSGGQKKMMCPRGDLDDPKCFNVLADQEGFIVVYPNGTGNPILKNVRTWNAGGGRNGYAKVNKHAVEKNIDDVAYIKALLWDIKKAVNVDESRIYATGISNGAAMSYRLACELSDTFAAIAPVAGGDQFSATENCSPSRLVAIIHFHGTEDQGWPFSGGKSRLADDKDGVRVSITETLGKWISRNGCEAAALKEEIPDRAKDGTRIEIEKYPNCRNDADIWLYKIVGGGHTWPDGWQYFPVAQVGKTTQNINANEIIWEFFKKHPLQLTRQASVSSKFTLGPGDHNFSLKYGDLKRTYTIHIPSQYDNETPTPVVIYVHGGGGNARAAYLDKMDKASDAFGFILAAPEGTGEIKFGQLRASWNGGKWATGECCGNADDVGFISAMIEKIKKDFNIDEKRIYATGISNGGLMTNRLGCELADKIAAIATVAPAGIESICSPSRPISVMDIHGTADTCNPYNGGEPPNSLCRNVSYTRMTNDQVVNRWLSINGCVADPRKINLNDKVSYTIYSNCKGGTEVVFVKVEGMGHAWPSGFESKLLGVYPVSYDISNDQIWEFFKQHPMK